MVTWDKTLDFSSLRVLQGTSKSPFLIIASDSYDYLNSLITALYERNLLVWSTRLLIVTRLPLQVIHHLKEILSNVNGMVLTKYKNGYTQGLLDGGHLISTSEVYPPHIMEKENSNEDDRILRNPFRGPGVEILKILSAVINFTTTVIRPPDGAYGVRSSNGTWNGMIGMQKRKEVDFSFAPFNILYARAQVVDYTSPFIIEYGRILARKGEVEANPFGFLLPLAPSVWGFLILSLVVLMAASFFMSFVYKPAERSIKEWSMTILVASWVIGMLVLIESYVGNLRSLLIARTVPQPYHSVRAVVDDPRIAVLWVAGVAYQQILQSFTSGVFKELADAGPNGKITYIDSTKFYEMVDTKVSAGTHVLVCEELTLKILVSSHFSNKGHGCPDHLTENGVQHLHRLQMDQEMDPGGTPPHPMQNEGVSQDRLCG
ncbi:glutamate receptor ionotropic, kainate 3-like [Macrobrachium nipponense]|uniref:glutamate receptor ionotropic, kainate 3-like n=1 Tax=Macrobrachium nipponense TaxID=159736 RepID=UPI0030C8C8BF